MGKTENFIDNAPYYKLWYVFISIGFAIGFGMLMIISGLSPKPIAMYIIIRLSLIMGAMMGIFGVLTVHSMRASTKFWKRAKEFEQKLFATNTSEGLKSIYEYDFEDVVDLANCSIHYAEVKRLHSMLQVKLSCKN